MDYNDNLKTAIESTQSCLCVGLDPNLARIPDSIKQKYPDESEQVLYFLKSVIDQTRENCAAYKPNLGFFEALGAPGLEVFQKVLEFIPSDKVVIADAKRGDISSTAEHYAKAYFEQFNVDAITINPLMGFESLNPFLEYQGKGVYTLTLTSNPGASDFLTQPFKEYATMASYIANQLYGLQKNHATHLGMVVGATKAQSISDVIQHHNRGALLIPGIGAQGGSIIALEDALKNHEGIPLINSSRSILYAGEHLENWEQAVKEKSLEFKKALKPITQKYVG